MNLSREDWKQIQPDLEKLSEVIRESIEDNPKASAIIDPLLQKGYKVFVQHQIAFIVEKVDGAQTKEPSVFVHKKVSA